MFQETASNAIFRCSRFHKFNLDFLVHNLLICSPKTENIFKVVCPLWTESSIISKEEEIFDPRNLDNGTNNFFFWLKVCLFGGLAKTSLNQFEQKPLRNTLSQKLELLSPQKRYICHQGGIVRDSF